MERKLYYYIFAIISVVLILSFQLQWLVKKTKHLHSTPKAVQKTAETSSEKEDRVLEKIIVEQMQTETQTASAEAKKKIIKNPDKKIVFDIFKKYADQHDELAAYMLGICYECGWGVEQNEQKAIEFFRKSANLYSKYSLEAYKIAHSAEFTKGVKIIANKDNTEIAFVRNNELLIVIKSQSGQLCFMDEIFADEERGIRFGHEYSNFSDPTFDFRAALQDLNGKNDFRYLIVGDYHVGSSPDNKYAYIIDAKDNFKLIYTTECGELLHLSYPDEDLTFPHEVFRLGYLNDKPIGVCFPCEYEVGRKPFVKPQFKKLTEKEITEKIISLKDIYKKNKPAAIDFLYKYLIESGNMKMGIELAKRIGFSQQEAEEYHSMLMKYFIESEYKEELLRYNL